MTEPTHLLDSNILIYIVQARFPELRDHIERCDPGALVTSAVAFAEVLLGAQDRREAEALRGLTEVVPVLEFDRAAADVYATLPFRRGRYDRLIGAHAASRGLTIVTNNEVDFADVPGLRVENWTLPL